MDNNDFPTSSPVIKKKSDEKLFSFAQCVEFLIDNRKITKKEWDNLEIYGVLIGSELRLHKDGVFHQWILSYGDLSGDDFIVLPEGN